MLYRERAVLYAIFCSCVSSCLLKAGFPSRLADYLRQAPPLWPSVCSGSSPLMCSFHESHEEIGELSTVGLRSQGSPNVSFSAESQVSVFPCTRSHSLFPLQLQFHCYFLAQDFRICCPLFWNTLFQVFACMTLLVIGSHEKDPSQYNVTALTPTCYAVPSYFICLSRCEMLLFYYCVHGFFPPFLPPECKFHEIRNFGFFSLPHPSCLEQFLVHSRYPANDCLIHQLPFVYNLRFSSSREPSRIVQVRVAFSLL